MKKLLVLRLIFLLSGCSNSMSSTYKEGSLFSVYLGIEEYAQVENEVDFRVFYGNDLSNEHIEVIENAIVMFEVVPLNNSYDSVTLYSEEIPSTTLLESNYRCKANPPSISNCSANQLITFNYGSIQFDTGYVLLSFTIFENQKLLQVDGTYTTEIIESSESVRIYFRITNENIELSDTRLT